MLTTKSHIMTNLLKTPDLFGRRCLTIIASLAMIFSFVATSSANDMSALPNGAIVVALPNAMLDVSVPSSTVILQPVTTTNIDAGLNYIGFQGDFLFDSNIVTFTAPFVSADGL